MDDVSLFLKGEKSLPQRAVAVTFDDGFKDNSSASRPQFSTGLAYPELFIFSLMRVDQSKAPWYCLLRYAFMTTRKPQWRNAATGIVHDLVDSDAREAAFVEQLRKSARNRARLAREELPAERDSSA